MNKTLLIFAFLATLATIKTHAQKDKEQPTDKVVMTNGEEKVGQVTEIGDTFVKFVYKGETLSYTLKKEDINKIQFASGRVEFFTEVKPSTSTTQGSTDTNGPLQDHHNIVAVLPITYIGLGGSHDDKMGMKAQSDCYNLLKKNAKQFNIQDPMTTNALLSKQGINESTIMSNLPAELANLLSVEYVVFATITVNSTGATTTGGGYYSEKDKGKKTTGYNVGSSSTSENFSTNVDMKIYTDQGQNVFAQSHESVWPSQDAYTMTLQYLIKRTPLYHK